MSQVKACTRSSVPRLAPIWLVILGAVPHGCETADSFEPRHAVKCVLEALRNYESTYGTLPPAVLTDRENEPVHSWRYLVAPFLDSPPFEYVRPEFGSWQDERYEGWRGYRQSCLCEDGTNTHLFTPMGDGTALAGSREQTLAALPASCIVIVYAEDHAAHWMSPTDIGLDASGAEMDTVGEYWGNTIILGFADGAIWRIDPKTPVDSLEPFLTIAGSKENDRDQMLLKYKWTGDENTR